MNRIEFRKISSILEYRELCDNQVYKTFGIQSHEPSYGNWKPMSGSKMLTLTSNELRTIADLIG